MASNLDQNPMQRGAEHSYQVSELLPVIGHPRRRQILECLPPTDSQSIDTILDQLDPRYPVETDRAIRFRLLHVHLPLLADHGFIDWDRATGDIRRGPCFDAIEPVLDRLETVTDDQPAEWLSDP